MMPHLRKSRSQTRSSRDRKIIQKKEKMHKQIRQQMGTPKCGPKQLVKEGYKRRSYTRRSGSRVKSAIIAPSCMRYTASRQNSKSHSRKSKGKQLFVLEKGTLGKYGYRDVKNMSTVKRHAALSRALKDMPPLSVYRKLNAVYVTNKNVNKNVADIFKKDRDWIQTTNEYKNRASRQ